MKNKIIQRILEERYLKKPVNQTVSAFAPTNIALIKYWGKRNTEINLPVTSSLSISLKEKGAKTTLSLNNKGQDIIYLNQQLLDRDSGFSHRLIEFLNLFRQKNTDYLDINIEANIPVAAGLASSACGFAALVQALNRLYGWNLTQTHLSVLARLGSGSACRSIWHGFVEWHMGLRDDGMDSHGLLINEEWPELRVGLLIMHDKEKTLSSREAMKRTVLNSPLYSCWSGKVDQDLSLIKQAIQLKDFNLMGKTAESNAMSMHALMLSAWPPISYAVPETILAMQKIWQLRKEGLNLYFTQDAGPNLKLLFLQKDISQIHPYFPDIEIIKPF